MLDKAIWVKWMCLRISGDVDGIQTPVGIVPKYEDLKKLFSSVLKKEYTEEDYIQQFAIRVPENLAKLQRMREIYETKVPDTPKVFFECLEVQEKGLKEARKKHGDYISPLSFL